MDEIGRNYLALALHLDRHFEGFVDAYFGPAEIKERVQAGAPRPLAALADDAQQLQAAIEAAGYDAQRTEFLRKQVRAMAAVVRNLAGDRLPFMEEVELYFDIQPEMVDEAVFEEAHAALDRLLPGEGALGERMEAWKKGLEIETEKVLPVFELALKETRRRTAALFELPEGENLTLELVSDQPWSAYNWYLGNYQSRVELNTDLPLRASSAIPLQAHEAYPGHHTEHALKEQILYHGEGRGEHAVQLLLAPECVVSEGLANSGRELIFDDQALAAFLGQALYPLAGLPDVDVEQQLALTQAAEGLRWVSANAALLLHREGRSAEEVQGYMMRYGLSTPKEAEQALRFLQNPLFRSYIFNYSTGKDLLAPLLAGADAAENFRRLLTEPLTPSQVEAWLAERGAS
jgi:hypothetical protein